ncbi:MAG: beta-phosphoglucomutase family hydrolase [Tidjanibacter sp.]|nr:beta-phosphoglucomutase family hydrolase [Tidjanibacter sp.]
MIKGVIFDMDGVLVNNMAVHFEAFAAMAERYNLKAEEGADFSHLNGRGNDDIINALFPKELVALKGVAALAEEKEALYREIYAPKIQPQKGLHSLLEELNKGGIICAVGSSGPKVNVDFVLEKCNIAPYFSVKISGDMVTRCKPDPEIFLTAAEKLGLKPDECLVFEDALAGVAAARAAGMKIVALTTTHTLEQLKQATPDLITKDFEGLSLETLLTL